MMKRWGKEGEFAKALANGTTLEQQLATAHAEAEALRSLLAEIVPPKLIGESHDPYPEGKTTILMDWEWLKRARAALERKP